MIEFTVVNQIRSGDEEVFGVPARVWVQYCIAINIGWFNLFWD